MQDRGQDHCEGSLLLGSLSPWPFPNHYICTLSLPKATVSRCQEEPRPALEGLACHTYSLALAAHHATFDVVVIVLEELVIGHLQLGQLPPMEKELWLVTGLRPSLLFPLTTSQP